LIAYTYFHSSILCLGSSRQLQMAPENVQIGHAQIY
jgi:hypothetical protein